MEVPEFIRGEFVNVSLEELNRVAEFEGNRDKVKKEYNGDIPPYFMFVSRNAYLSSDLTADGFKRTCLDRGYKLIHIYPIYYQGWEMDQWGAIGLKDGKRFRLETNHGQLEVEPYVA